MEFIARMFCKMHLIRPYLITILIFLVFACNLKQDSPRLLYRKGLEFYKQNKYEEAVIEFKKAIELGGTSEELYRKLISSYRESGNIEQGLTYFRRLSRENPENPRYEFAQGLLFKAQDSSEVAFNHLKRSVELGIHHGGAFTDLGYLYQKLKKLNEGENEFQSLIREHPDSGLFHYGLGVIKQLQGEPEEALVHFDKALELNPDILEAYQMKGRIYFLWGRFREGFQVFTTGLREAERQENFFYQGKFLGSAGAMSIGLSEYDSGLVMLRKAVEKSGRAGERRDQGRWLGNMGNAYYHLGQPLKAIDQFKKAAQIAHEINDKSAELTWLNNIGGLYITLGHYVLAIDHLEKALTIVRESHDVRNEFNILENIGNAYGYLGEFDTALDYFRSSLRLAKQSGDLVGQMRMTANIGSALGELGHYTEALGNYDEAMALADTTGDKNNKASFLQEVGRLYMRLDDDSTALRYYQSAVKIAEDINSPRIQGISLMRTGTIYRRGDQYDKAIESYQSALTVFQKIHDRKNYSEVLHNIGLTYFNRNDYALALKYIQQAYDSTEAIGHKLGMAYQSIDLGEVTLRQNLNEQAGQYFQDALKSGEQLRVPDILWRAWYGLGRVHETEGRIGQALKLYRMAVNSIEHLRMRIPTGETRSLFLQNKTAVYHRLIGLLFEFDRQQRGSEYGAEAFLYSERAKARALLDMLAESKIDIRKRVDPALLLQEKEIFRKISRLQTTFHSARLTEIQKQSILDSLKKSEQMLQAFQRKIRRVSPLYADLEYPNPVDMKTVQQDLLKEGDVLLEYNLGKTNSFLFAVTRDNAQFLALPSVNVINRQVNIYLSEIGNSPGTPSTSSAKLLWDMLLSPARDVLRDARQLIIVPDGILHYLPFESLVMNRKEKEPRYLLQRYAVRYGPSASVLNYLKQRSGNSASGARLELLAVGNPLFGKRSETLARAAGEPETVIRKRGHYKLQPSVFMPLPFSSEEIDRIANLFPENRTTVYRQAEATEENIKTGHPKRYRRIHFATHSLIDEVHPEQSSIVLTLDDDPTEDGFLRTSEIFNLPIDADLVVLSACRSGRGKLVSGEGIIGLARAFFYAGARSLVVSLWSVNDQSTALLMEKFYAYLKQGMHKSEALRQAKLDLLQTEDSAMSHPYYWAPFILIGSNR